jgi:RNA polymerase II subunit A-like phosphatase
VQHGTVKVDAARKRGGTKIVWLSWFTDSIALWHRQDETPYLLDDTTLAVPQPSSSSATTVSHQISSDPDPDNDDWDEEPTEIGKVAEGAELDLDEIDWNDVNDEVDAAMNESDDDDDSKSEKSGMRSGNVSDEEGSGTDGSHSGIRYDLPDTSYWYLADTSLFLCVASTPNSSPKKRKRLRSLTPSEIGVNGNSDSLRSPLSKRKKLAAERTGASRLKDSISADDLVENHPTQVALTTLTKEDLREEEEGEGEDDEDDGDLDDDFLAGALEEEWG